MDRSDIVTRAFEAFRADVLGQPPLSLRGANALDGYGEPTPFDATADEPTDGYLEGFAFWGTTYLDAQSWRHYLPRLIDYTFRHPDDPAMVAEALVRSLRPPDRYPPRLATLGSAQESVVTSIPAIDRPNSHAAQERRISRPSDPSSALQTAMAHAATAQAGNA